MSKRSQSRKRQLYGRDSSGYAGVAPANTVNPVIAGTATAGSTLTLTSPGTWTGYPIPQYTYQWRATSVNIPGATGLTTVAQAGKIMDCRVTATNSAGATSATSNALSIP